MTDERRGPGRPPKLDGSDMKAVLEKIQREIDKADASAASKLDKLYKKLESVAFTGKLNGKDVNLKDQLITIRYYVDRLEKKVLDAENVDGQKGKVEDNSPQKEEDEPLISLVAPIEK